MNSTTYDGSPIEHMIADQTDPWIEVDNLVVDWWPDNDIVTGEFVPNTECENTCNGGVLLGTNTPSGIQRCDSCDKYDGDLSAALAVATSIGGTVHYEIEEDE